MPNVGLKHFFISKLVSDTAADGCTYATAPVALSKPIESKFSPELAEAELYAGDELAEYAAEFAKGTLSIGIKDENEVALADILGQSKHTVTIGSGENAKTSTEVISKGADLGDFHGFAQVLPIIENGVRKWKAEILLKVRFKPYSNERKTKGNSIEFGTPTLDGIAFLNAKDEYKATATWETLEDAVAYVASRLPVAAPPTEE